MKKTRGKFLAVAILFSSTTGSPQGLAGRWKLDIENQQHQVVTSFVVEFTHRVADSCTGGDWHRVDIVSAVTRDKGFFPVAGPLSYQIQGQEITLGRNDICDAYLHLNGLLKERTISGDYYSFGLRGSTPLGFFTLEPAKPAPATPARD